jgi:hypothetical protein
MTRSKIIFKKLENNQVVLFPGNLPARADLHSGRKPARTFMNLTTKLPDSNQRHGFYNNIK